MIIFGFLKAVLPAVQRIDLRRAGVETGSLRKQRKKVEHGTPKAAGSMHLDLVSRFLFPPEPQDKNLLREREFARKSKFLASSKIWPPEGAKHPKESQDQPRSTTLLDCPRTQRQLQASPPLSQLKG